MVELMSPVSDEATLLAAIRGGADSVYFGVSQLNMRATAKNFQLNQLPKIVSLCHENSVKAYLTLNTIIYDGELNVMKKIVDAAKAAGIDAVIAWDFAVIQECLRKEIKVCLSTQASVSNFEAVKFYHDIGIKRIVLARELSLEQIKHIIKMIKDEKLGIEIETFIHGAMCVSHSGRCFTSQFLYNRSANRGDCLHPCRRSYKVIDIEEGHELKLERSTVMSPKDLCTIKILDVLIGSGIDVFKIEGRSRSPEYVAAVTGIYRRAIDAYSKGMLTDKLKDELYSELDKVYNRGFSEGFYMAVPVDGWSSSYGSTASTRKDYIGYVKSFFKKINVAEIKLESDSLSVGEDITVIGSSTGVLTDNVLSMRDMKDDEIDFAQKGSIVCIKTTKQLRPNDKIFKIRKV